MQPAAAAIASEAVAFQVIISFTDSIIGFFFFLSLFGIVEFIGILI